MRKAAHIAIAVLTAATLATAAYEAYAVPAVGAVAPDFVLKSDSGKNIRLKELRGQVVLINFWASWCAPCARELPLLNKLHEKYQPAGFALLGINVDSKAKRRDAEEMLRRAGARFTVLYDPEQEVVARYQDGPERGSMPLTLIVDRDGKVRYVHRGYREGYEKKYDEQVRELLKE